MARAARSLIERVMPLAEQGVIIITPTLRLARALRADLAEAQLSAGGVARTPRVEVYGAWLESQWYELVEQAELPVARLLSGLEAEELWLEIISEDMTGGAEFTLLSPQSAARSALTCRDALLRFCAPSGLGSLFSQDPDCRRFFSWLETFEQRLGVSGWLTAADMELAVKHSIKPASNKLAVIVDEPLTPLAKSVLTASTDSLEVIAAREAGDSIRVQVFADPDDEYRAAATWAAEHHAASPGETAIVLLNMSEQRFSAERAIREAFDCLDARYDSLPVNFSQGVPFAATPMYRDALVALRALCAPVSRADFLTLVTSPYLASMRGVGESVRLALIERVFALGMDPIPRVDLTEQLQRMGESPLLEVMRHAASGRMTQLILPAREWRAQFVEVLRLWGWPAREEVDSYEFQLVERFEEVLDDFERAAASRIDMSFRSALGLLTRVLDRRQFQPRTDDNSVQVLSAKEAAGLGFDHVWVLGAQSGQFPRRASLLPFIPAKLQKELGMPVASDPEGILAARQWLAGLTSASGDVVLSGHSQADGVEQLLSPLLLNIDPEPEVQPPATHTSQARWHSWLSGDEVLERITDSGAGPVSPEQLAVRGGTTLLRDQSQCPFRGWVGHRLGVRPLSASAFGLTSAEKGNVLHAALRHLWGLIGTSSRLSAADDERIEQWIGEAADTAISAVSPAISRRVGSGCLEVERQHLKQLLATWLTVERKRELDFTVIESEQSHKLSLEGVTLKLIVDRIDQLADGRRVVIDYKSGSQFSMADWWGDRLREPQLPSYALLDAEVAGIAWAGLGGRQPKFVALGEDLGIDKAQAPVALSDDESPLSWEQLRAGWLERLQRVVASFLAGHTDVDPLPNACRYCSYQSVCRIHEPDLPDAGGERE